MMSLNRTPTRITSGASSADIAESKSHSIFSRGQIDEVYMISDDLNDDAVRTLYEEYVVFEREARVIKPCHSLQHVLRCEKCSNSLVSLVSLSLSNSLLIRNKTTRM